MSYGISHSNVRRVFVDAPDSVAPQYDLLGEPMYIAHQLILSDALSVHEEDRRNNCS